MPGASSKLPLGVKKHEATFYLLTGQSEHSFPNQVAQFRVVDLQHILTRTVCLTRRLTILSLTDVPPKRAKKSLTMWGLIHQQSILSELNSRKDSSR
jgi:hypothetical protein